MVESKTKERIDYTKIVLFTIGITGIVAVSVLAPNIFQAFPKLGLTGRHRRYYLPKVIANLENKNLIKIVAHNGSKCYRLTPKGQDLLQQYENKSITIPRPRKWDGKYRVVIFDIKEHRRTVRDEIRDWLEHLGFIRLQNSVWVHPYECREIVALLKANYRIGKEVIYMTVNEIENDYWLKKAFNLS